MWSAAPAVVPMPVLVTPPTLPPRLVRLPPLA